MPLVPRRRSAPILELTLLFQTIISTSLPTIASELHASQTQYTWVGVAYMLTQTAFQPLYGKISDLIGRKVSNSLRVMSLTRRISRLFYTLA
jgi:MFS family permease